MNSNQPEDTGRLDEVIFREGNAAHVQEIKAFAGKDNNFERSFSYQEGIRDPEMLRFGLSEITRSNPHP